MSKKKSMNPEIVASNLAEAIQQLEELRTGAANGTRGEEAFQIGLLHAYHHLNFSWNIRYVATSQYANLTKRQFNRWGKYPSNIEKL